MKVAEDYSQVTYLPAPAGTKGAYRISKRSSGKRGVVKSIKIDDHFCGKELSPVVHKDGSFSYITPEKYQEILQAVKPLAEGKIVRMEVPIINIKPEPPKGKLSLDSAGQIVEDFSDWLPQEKQV